MTIHIYYRHVPSGRSLGKLRPDWFSHERCLANLLQTIEQGLANGEVRLIMVFDGSAASFAADFAAKQLAEARARAGVAAVDMRFISGGDQRKAWRACMKLVLEDSGRTMRPGDLIYLLENDYLHLPGWVEEVQGLAEAGVNWDYLSLYDHPDKYPNACAHHDAGRYQGLRSRLYVTAARHWRSTPSACATYLLSRETFLKDHALLRLGIYDFRLFKLLTRLRRRALLSPLPSLSTHCMSELLAPAVDWAKVAGHASVTTAARPA